MNKPQLEETLRKHAVKRTTQEILDSMKSLKFKDFTLAAPKIVGEYPSKLDSLREKLAAGETIEI